MQTERNPVVALCGRLNISLPDDLMSYCSAGEMEDK